MKSQEDHQIGQRLKIECSWHFHPGADLWMRRGHWKKSRGSILLCLIINRYIKVTRKIIFLFFLFQILNEFEMILGLQSSVGSSFASNFNQVADAIIDLAKAKKKCPPIENLLKLLEADPVLDDADQCENTIGKPLLELVSLTWIKWVYIEFPLFPLKISVVCNVM